MSQYAFCKTFNEYKKLYVEVSNNLKLDSIEILTILNKKYQILKFKLSKFIIGIVINYFLVNGKI